MPNIASALKEEISRVARKEMRAEIAPLQKSVAKYRSQIAALRRQVLALERLMKLQTRKGSVIASEVEREDESHRFSAKGLAAHRQRLGLSAANMAKLLGVSALSVYKWESGKTRPRAKQIEAIAALRKLGKREVARRLEELAAA
jgi:DNA-binding transcriptional regulator YiaG